MRKIIYYAATSIDGYIARTDGSVDWLFAEGDFGFNTFYETVRYHSHGEKDL